jgi:phosphatidylserine synthase
MGKPWRAHFQMLRSFTWADLFTFGNASCGTVCEFLCLDYLTEGQRGFLWAIFGLLPLAAVFDGLDGYMACRWGQRSTLGTELDSLADIISFVLFVGVREGRCEGGRQRLEPARRAAHPLSSP